MVADHESDPRDEFAADSATADSSSPTDAPTSDGIEYGADPMDSEPGSEPDSDVAEVAGVADEHTAADANQAEQDAAAEREEQLTRLFTATVMGPGEERIGKVGQVYLDDQTQEPNWITVRTGLFGTKEYFIPLDEAQLDGKHIVVPYAKTDVTTAPSTEIDQNLSPDEEDALYNHYRVPGRMTDDAAAPLEAADDAVPNAGALGFDEPDAAGQADDARFGADSQSDAAFSGGDSVTSDAQSGVSDDSAWAPAARASDGSPWSAPGTTENTDESGGDANNSSAWAQAPLAEHSNPWSEPNDAAEAEHAAASDAQDVQTAAHANDPFAGSDDMWSPSDAQRQTPDASGQTADDAPAMSGWGSSSDPSWLLDDDPDAASSNPASTPTDQQATESPWSTAVTDDAENDDDDLSSGIESMFARDTDDAAATGDARESSQDDDGDDFSPFRRPDQ